MSKTYDVKCYDLAKAFLDDVFNAANWEGNGEPYYVELAKEIQQTIEDYLSGMET